jgi:bla regulator protein BlaR1
MQKVTLIGAGWLFLVIPAFAQEATATTNAQPKVTRASDGVHGYEIVSIKPNKTGDSGGMRRLPDGFGWNNIPLSSLVHGSYGIVMDSQVIGMPDWARWENYDIVAKADADTAERWEKLSGKERWGEEQPMMRLILADRCRFKAHQETKELPVCDLVIAKGGLKIKEAPPNEKPMEIMSGGQMTVHAMAIDTIVHAFPGSVGRIIVDKTGLGDKKFDFDLKWTDDRRSSDDEAPSLLTAFEEQLGLKLVPARGRGEVLIIDHMERPSPN